MKNLPIVHFGMNRREFMRTAAAAGIASAVNSRPVEAETLPAVTAASTEGSASTRADELHRLEPVPIDQVVIEDEFWSPKRKVWQEVTIRDSFTKFENYKTGTLNNFDRVRAGERGNHAGDPWWDGLIYEMIRGSSDFLLNKPDPDLERQLDGYIARITAAAAVNPSGYINTYTQLVEPGHEWGLNGGFERWQHELYNLGALIDAGVHYYRATGKTALLTAGVKIANYMNEFIGPPPKKNLISSHGLPEEALIRLHELFKENPELKKTIPLHVDETEYLKLAEFLIENHGNNIGKPDWEKDNKAAVEFVRSQKYGAGRPSWGAYSQDDASVFEQKDIHGHAVRATLLCAGIAAAARINDDERYRMTAIRLWESMALRRMYITGSVGSFRDDEKFGSDFVLPNDGWLETCASVGAGFFHHNMNMAFGHSRYVDELERTLYNGVLVGVSLKGDTYFYENPLAFDMTRTRWTWHTCPCCPPMFLKMMGAMPSYIYATDLESIYVNLFVGSKARTEVEGTKVSIRQVTRYPWEGTVRITVDPEKPLPFALMLRIPAWSNGETVRVNGQRIRTDQRVRGYLRIDRKWNPNDVIELSMPMPARQVFANPLVQANVGRSAIMRGPLVYCVESADNSTVPQLQLPRSAVVKDEFDEATLGGVVVVTADGSVFDSSSLAPYTAIPKTHPLQQVKIKAIPYYANANRGPVDMTVWLPLTT
jgi:DUF1680 family protein